MRSATPRAGGALWRQLALLVALVVLVLDQLSKQWAVQHLASSPGQPFWPGLLNLRLVYNTGAAFSLFTGAPRLLAAVSLAVSAALLLWLLRRSPRGPWDSLAFGFLLGGALGNGLDRWRLGAVVDFLALVPIPFPVFNLADVAINLAVFCFLMHLSPWRRSSEGSHG